MLALVTGGSGSGKSAWAEDLAQFLCPGSKTYLATMRPGGREAQARIQRHRALRAGKGFQTAECPDGFARLRLPPGETVLLEDLSNLAANRRFSPAPPDDCAGVLLEELDGLAARCTHLIVVSNEIFSDGVAYDPDTTDYLTLLGELNCALARRAELVVEVVCGLPLVLKGALPWARPL